MFDIDLESGPGAALLAALADRHGDALARAARLPSRLFLLRSPYAPGLRFIGGEVDPRRSLTSVPFQGSFNLAGSGDTLEDAFAACIGEGVERLSQVERAGDAVRECSYDEAAPQIMPAARSVIETLLLGSPSSPKTPVAWVRGHAPATGREILIPADWCLRRQIKGSLAIPGAALSTGCAAGPTFDAAASRALLEIVERDAVSLWWIGGQRPRPLASEGAAMAEAVRLLGILRQGTKHRASWLLDVTTDLNIPCVVAVSVNESGQGFACGLAARPSFEAAARAAILEMCQMELAVPLVMVKRQQRGDEALNAVDRRHLDLATKIAADRCALIHPLGSPSRDPALVCNSPQEALAAGLAALARCNVEVALIDLTRSELGIPVVCAIAPELQLMPCNLRTARLRRAISATGGGERWTDGVALL